MRCSGWPWSRSAPPTSVSVTVSELTGDGLGSKCFVAGYCHLEMAAEMSRQSYVEEYACLVLGRTASRVLPVVLLPVPSRLALVRLVADRRWSAVGTELTVNGSVLAVCRRRAIRRSRIVSDSRPDADCWTPSSTAALVALLLADEPAVVASDSSSTASFAPTSQFALRCLAN